MLKNLIRFSIDHAALVLSLAVALLGLAAFLLPRTPVDVFPELSAPTVVVMTEAPGLAAFRAAHLYPRERRARYRVGSVLFYRHDTWHRGTPLDPGTMRLAQNLTFRKAQSEWISVLHPGWAWAMYRRSRVMERLLAAASVEQRCVLGFPKPGHPYWTPETLAAVKARYAALDFDATPYESGLGRSGD